jgi:hypothetical protein
MLSLAWIGCDIFLFYFPPRTYYSLRGGTERIYYEISPVFRWKLLLWGTSCQVPAPLRHIMPGIVLKVPVPLRHIMPGIVLKVPDLWGTSCQALFWRCQIFEAHHARHCSKGARPFRHIMPGIVLKVPAPLRHIMPGACTFVSDLDSVLQCLEGNLRRRHW